MNLPQTTVLLTYFGAFEGVATNPTQTIVTETIQRLAHSAPQLCVQAQELPVTFDTSGDVLKASIQETNPDLVLCCGVAVGREKLSIERVAINLDDASIRDNSGQLVQDRPIREQGPAAYFSSLPTRQIFERAHQEGLPVELSYSAGTYVCNHIFYELMHMIEASPIRGGFIHVPALEEAESNTQLKASKDAGGLEGTSLARLPLEVQARSLELIVLSATQTDY